MAAAVITGRERSAFGLIAILAFLYVLVRAVSVPLVHDEAGSYLWFVQPGELFPFHAHWDANNHVVNTLCGWAGDRLFGTSLLALRWGNVLAFVVYTVAVYRLGRGFVRPLLRWVCWMALLLCPFVIELFSLFRGYGIGVAGCLFAVERTIAFHRSGHARVVWTGLLALVIAVFADLSLLPLALLVAALIAVHAWDLRRSAPRTVRSVGFALVLLAVVPLAAATYLALLMQRLGLLYHGSLAGFVPVTLGSLSQYVLGTSLVAGAIAVTGTLLLGAAVVWCVRRRDRSSALAIMTALLVGEVAARLVLGYGRGVNFPEDRAAIHLVPLFICCCALLADALADRWAWARWPALVLLVLPLRTLITANADHTVLWPEQSIPLRFTRTIAERQQQADRPLLVGGYHQLALCWPLGARLVGVDVPPLESEGFPEGEHDLRIVDARFIRQARPGYREIDHADGPGLWLLERETPLRPLTLDSFSIPDVRTDAEFTELAHPPLQAVREEELWADIRCTLSTTYPTLEITVVTEVTDSTGNKLFYDTFSPLAMRKDWNANELHVMRRIARCPHAARAVIYIYNKDHHPLSIDRSLILIRLPDGHRTGSPPPTEAAPAH